MVAGRLEVAAEPTTRPARAPRRGGVVRPIGASLFALALATPFALPAYATVTGADGTVYSVASGVDGGQSVTADGTTFTPAHRDGYDVIEPAEATVASTGGADDLGWVLPAPGRISSPFGPRPDQPVAGVNLFHSGTDLAGGCGTDVVAAHAGTVVAAGWLGTYGNWVLIDHGDGIQTGYAHNSSINVSVGDEVSAGEQVAVLGSTGASTGCHLHFEVRVDDTRVDAVPFMAARGITLG